MKTIAFTSLEKSWGGYSTFRPLRQAEEDDDPTPEGIAKLEKKAGLYGHTKRIQTGVEGTIRKLSRFTAKLAHDIWQKDHAVADFLSDYSQRQESKAARALLQEMSEIGPKVKLAGAAPKGMYGYKNKTVTLGLSAVHSVLEQAGLLSLTLSERFPTDYHKILHFMDEHIQAETCPYAHLLASAYPKETQGKKASQRTAENLMDSGAGDAAHFFFADPKRMEVREFARSQAVSNVGTVTKNVGKTYDQLDSSKAQLNRDTKDSPNTPSENLKYTPGSKEFSTLSRYLVTTAEPTHKDVPQSRDDIKKEPNLAIEHDQTILDALNRSNKEASLNTWTFCIGDYNG